MSTFSKFQVGDRVVRLTGEPITVTVLEFGACDEDDCDRTTFRFKDPESGEDDWEHAGEFRKVGN